LVEMPRVRQVVVRGEQMTTAHLAASCAVPLGFPPVRIHGQWYVDGGLLAAVPLRAAVEMGATSAVVINALPVMPSVIVRTVVRLFRAVAAPKQPLDRIRVTEIRPSEPLGSVRDAIRWNKQNAVRWMELGMKDAASANVR
jgi:predicted acylesterase/phospholipase RssA